MTKLLLTTATVWCALCLTGIQGWMPNNPMLTRSNTQRGSLLPNRLTLLRAAANNNIVLKPSEDPAAFDSFKIGSARVHRYSREDESDSQTQYIMWYHGRSKGMDDAALPPLSTGRIGRATSKNGLIWEKQLAGSLSEDAPDVNLGLNNESWWGFDTAHVGLGNVLLPMSTPAVMTEGGVYLMYYMGGNFEETPVVDYMEKEIPEAMQDAKIQGMKMRIGVALSQDGVSFGRVEGDDPTGACMVPFDRTDPNVDMENVPLDMDEELYCGWPEVAVDVKAKADSAFLMFYSTMTKNDKQKCIAYAISPDGFKWTKQGVCLRPDESGLDAAGCARCNVVQDAVYDEDLGTWESISAWTMYYEGVSPEDGKHRIMMAQSKDGKKWSKIGLTIDVGQESEDAWDSAGVGSPHIIRMDDGSQRMYYTGQGTDGSTAVGVAKLLDGQGPTAWVREQATFVFN